MNTLTNVTTAIAFSLISAISTAALIQPADAATGSQCKGLAQTECSQNTACKWQAQMVKGEKSPVSGKPYKVGRKAHCRLGQKKKASELIKLTN